MPDLPGTEETKRVCLGTIQRFQGNGDDGAWFPLHTVDSPAIQSTCPGFGKFQPSTVLHVTCQVPALYKIFTHYQKSSFIFFFNS